MFFKRKKKTQRPYWDQAGITAFVDDVQIRIDWDQVVGVYAYKKDCFTTDQIRLIISSKEWEVEFTEDDVQFNELRAYITERLNLSTDWYQPLLSSPAFELTWTVVYSAEAKMSEEIR